MVPDVAASFRELAPIVGHVQVGDVPDRHEPGTGAIEWVAFFAALADSGYDGSIGLRYRAERGDLRGPPLDRGLRARALETVRVGLRDQPATGCHGLADSVAGCPGPLHGGRSSAVMSRPGIGMPASPERSTTCSGNAVPSSHQLLNRIVNVVTPPGSSVGPGSSAGGWLSMMAVPAASRIATDGPAGRVQAAEPRFSTETSAPREPAAAPHEPPVRARSSGEHAPPPAALAAVALAAAVGSRSGVGRGSARGGGRARAGRRACGDEDRKRDEERAAEGAERVVHVRSLQSIGGRARVHHPPRRAEDGAGNRSWQPAPLSRDGMGGYGMSTFERSVPL